MKKIVVAVLFFFVSTAAMLIYLDETSIERHFEKLYGNLPLHPSKSWVCHFQIRRGDDGQFYFSTDLPPYQDQVICMNELTPPTQTSDYAISAAFYSPGNYGVIATVIVMKDGLLTVEETGLEAFYRGEWYTLPGLSSGAGSAVATGVTISPYQALQKTFFRIGSAWGGNTYVLLPGKYRLAGIPNSEFEVTKQQIKRARELYVEAQS